MNFSYGETELDYLKNRDAKLKDVIDQIGYIPREVDLDLFSSVVHNIAGQQISTKALETIWMRIQATLGEINADTILDAGMEKLQSCGISFRKADYITDFARKVKDGDFDIESIYSMSDQEAIDYLVSLKGIGVWTAEMILLFSLERPNIFSFDDLGIKRGLRMIYHHRNIDKKLFEKYRRRYSPYCSVASFYLWAVANGALPEMKDYAPKSKK